MDRYMLTEATRLAIARVLDFKTDKRELELLADHLIANGIGDITAETAKWDMLCNKLGNIIANGDDCENNCCQGFLDMVNEIKHYDSKYDRQLAHEKHRADVAEEALRLAIKRADISYFKCNYTKLCNFRTYECGSEECINIIMETYKQEAEERLKKIGGKQ